MEMTTIMTCDQCDQIQEAHDRAIYVRIGRSNVEVYACEEHGAWLIAAIREKYDREAGGHGKAS